MDTKSYDPYIINYTSNPTTNDTGVKDSEEVKTEENTTKKEKTDVIAEVLDEMHEEAAVEFFNPFNLDSYSKFGTTCLHEAIRSRNVDMVELLLSRGADANQQVFEFSAASSPSQQQPKPISNCLCEAMRLKVNMLTILKKDKLNKKQKR